MPELSSCVLRNKETNTVANEIEQQWEKKKNDGGAKRRAGRRTDRC